MIQNWFFRSFLCFLISVTATNSSFASKIAMIQYKVQDLNEVGVDADRLETFIREAAGQGAELIVAPETSFYRYEPWEQDGVTMLDLANQYDALVERFTNLAADLKISLVIGLREPSGDKEKPVYNTALFIGPDGKILGKQHKIFPSNAEMSWTKPGNAHSVFETPLGRVGMMICKTAKTNWWNSFEKEDDLDLFILIAGDKDASSFDHFSTICVKSDCHGLLANQICGDGEGSQKGNSSWCYPDGTVEMLGEKEKIFYNNFPIPVEDSFLPQPGQIIVDPHNPAWLVYNRDNDHNGRLDPYFMCGPGDPEGFLYRGTRNPNGTRNGDQSALISKVVEHGGNCIYLMAVRTHGGDAWKDAENDPEHYPDSRHNPWVGQHPGYGLNPDILDQWELWFTEMDRNGITIYLFFYDDAIKVGEQLGWHLDESGNLHPGEKKFIQEIVNKFEHHKNLVWSVMEEGQEIGRDWKQHISKIAETISNADDHNHVIASHQLGGSTFFHAEDPNIDQFAIQGNWETGSTPDSMHNWLLQTGKLSSGRYNLNMSEYKGHEELLLAGDEQGFRKMNWAIALAGSYCMAIGLDIHTHTAQLKDCRRLQEFFESTFFNEMAPHDELKHAGTQYVLASPGYSYIAYSSIAAKHLGLKNMNPGTYHLRWYDCITGQSLENNSIKISKGIQSWEKPSGFSEEVALYITRADGKSKPDRGASAVKENQTGDDQGLTAEISPNIPPVAPDQRIHTKTGIPLSIQLTYDDPDGGPGPYYTEIIIHPSYGKLSGVGNDQVYTPVPGYTGNDKITWKVNDGMDDSELATIYITVEP